MAVAARAVSLEESVRSTLRMKRAADAIALEDAQLRVSAIAAGREVRQTLKRLRKIRESLSGEQALSDGVPRRSTAAERKHDE